MSFDDDDARVLARLARLNHHSSLTSDESQQNYLRALMLARDIESEGCEGCDVLAAVLPAAGTRWVVEQHHESTCALFGEDGASV